MPVPLESAPHPESLRRVAIEPISRVEGHGKITLLLDEQNHVQQARLHIVEFRGFEKFIQGRPYWELPVMVQRLCGICPVSHHLAAAKAVDRLVGVSRLTPPAEKLRRLLHAAQTLQSHALHFFHLASPDLLFGFESEVARRNLVGVLQAFPDVALQGVKLRKYGQEIIHVLAGKRIHGVLAIPGGVNKNLSLEERDRLLGDLDSVLAWSREAVALAKGLYEAGGDAHRNFANFTSCFLGLVAPDGSLDLYDGGLRALDPQGRIIFDHVDGDHYRNHLREEVQDWTYMKFPYLVQEGPQNGWYRVGPLARLNLCNAIPTPWAEQERRIFQQEGQGGPVQASLGYHWARMIELLAAGESIQRLLLDPDLQRTDLVIQGSKTQEGIGVIEAPRGTLIHHYWINEEDTVEKANLIVSTTHNNQAMNRAIREVATHYLDGKVLTEGLLNHLEVAIRAYDPCLSCATHALGRMPLEVELRDAEAQLIHRIVRDGDGHLCS